ncbi:protein disulfide oxidoreductase [Vibrio sinensis]|uniref:Protein disulfide oxidoreductase n=1 Tax=Vibrio sinensis TaxID=2302434 RepID=A0A3A6QMM7_9VIBR|nr:protein disulfide oxidoreductase [Vibrio sinensis]RJX73743.1 protein disulfide oxidoreductase [Vibrio sinensis]
MNVPTKKPRWRYWLKEFFFALVIITGGSYAMDFYHSSDAPVGPAPEIQALDINGDLIDVNALSHNGEPVIVYFWATWCGSCKWVSPTIDWFANDHQVVTVALSSGENSRIQAYLTAKQLGFPVINDAQGTISREWGISVTPTIAIIKGGEIKYMTAGITTPWGLWLRTLFS